MANGLPLFRMARERRGAHPDESQNRGYLDRLGERPDALFTGLPSVDAAGGLRSDRLSMVIEPKERASPFFVDFVHALRDRRVLWVTRPGSDQTIRSALRQRKAGMSLEQGPRLWTAEDRIALLEYRKAAELDDWSVLQTTSLTTATLIDWVSAYEPDLALIDVPLRSNHQIVTTHDRKDRLSACLEHIQAFGRGARVPIVLRTHMRLSERTDRIVLYPSPKD